MPINASSLTKRLTGYFSKAGVTAGLLFVLRLLSGLWSAVWFLLVLLGLLLFVIPDFLPKRKSKPLTSPLRQTRLLPVPHREGSDIFVIMPDGTKVPLEPLEAKLQAQAWFEVVSGAMVFEKTRIRVDENR